MQIYEEQVNLYCFYTTWKKREMKYVAAAAAQAPAAAAAATSMLPLLLPRYVGRKFLLEHHCPLKEESSGGT